MKDMFRKLKSKIVRYFYEKSRLWGISYDSNKPPEFIITEHAEERMRERLTIGAKQRERLMIAAWFSKLVVPQSFIKRKENIQREKEIGGHIYYRRYGGLIWVFGNHWIYKYQMSQKTLITLYPEDY